MSDKQRNTSTNESDTDTPTTAKDEAVADRAPVDGADTVAVATKSSFPGRDEDGPGQGPETRDDAVEAPAVTTSSGGSDTGGATSAEKPSEESEGGEPEAGSPGRGAASEATGSSATKKKEEAVDTRSDQSTGDTEGPGGTEVTESKTAAAKQPSAVKATLSSRRAHLTVSRVEPWSVMKYSFVVSLVCFIVLFVAVVVIYTTLSMLGVFDELSNMMTALLEGDGSEDELGLNPSAWFSPGRVLGYTGVVGALNIVLITALATVGAMLYNLVADLVGGIDLTLTEAE
ncbi:DUF3566 domain-containing protein [Nocardiopsis sp. CNT312]|uniref:DUF3566 domain-containing protein n=1 Tax=Nocardiopsis sp. CNT312 TaxID=1137268 RepID=UPI00048D973A|nr:DUF3566 domain-containing protein [Nocardiopsis sp. CNT312]